MQLHTSVSRFEEPLRRTLVRNVSLAAGVGALLALQRHSLRWFLPVAALALWFSLGGHYVELAFLNSLRARLSQGRLTQVALRLLVWFTGGVVLYVLMAASARVLPLEAPPLGMWWYGAWCSSASSSRFTAFWQCEVDQTSTAGADRDP